MLFNIISKSIQVSINKFLFIFLCVIIISCNKGGYKVDNSLGHDYTLNSAIINLYNDTLYRTIDLDCVCKKIGDTTYIIMINSGPYVGRSYGIEIFEKKYSSSYQTWGDVPVEDNTFKTLEQTLTLNKTNLKVCNYLEGRFTYRGYTYNELLQNKDVYLKIEGGFSCVIKDSLYSLINIKAENRINNYLRLLSGRPDTVTKLNLGNLGFRQIPLFVDKFKNIETLVLPNNDIKKLRIESLANLALCKELNLNDNNIEFLPEKIDTLESLRILKINRNQLTELPKKFSNLKQLRYLDLGYNNLKMLPNNIHMLENLETLILYGKENNFEIPEGLYNTKSLKEIWFQDNLTHISGNITSLNNLEFIALPYNVLYKNLPLFLRMKSLKEIIPYYTYSSREDMEKYHKQRVRKLEGLFPDVRIGSSYSIQ